MTTPILLSPSDKIGNASFGCCMAMSSDGKTAVIGGLSDNGTAGAAWVFTRSSNNWTQQGSKLVGSSPIGASYFGTSVALSADGSTLIVGGRGDNSWSGAAWIFQRSSSGVWTEVTKLTGTGAFGTSVALSYHGDVALIGGSMDGSRVGAAWVYSRQGTSWSTTPTKLVSPDPNIKSFGISVDLSADGTTALIGASGIGSAIGAAWIFKKSVAQAGQPAVWSQPATKLPDRSDRGNNFGFGMSVSLSADGSVALVGSFGNVTAPSQAGAWIFTNNGTSWTQQGSKLIVSNPYLFGQSVSLSANGQTAIVSDWNMSTGGIGWIFQLNSGNWTLQNQNITGPAKRYSGYSVGGSVAVSADAKTFLASGYDQDIDGIASLINEDSWEITHIFVLMLENHSFDNIFGCSGIEGLKTTAASSKNTYSNQEYTVQKTAPAMMPTDPAHEFEDIMEQQCGLAAKNSWVNGTTYPSTITNEGFVSNYATSRSEIHEGNPVLPNQPQYADIMKCFDTPSQLPVLHQLATEFAVCDQWFSSLPGPTFPNRAFLHGGSSSGLADSPAGTSPGEWAIHGFEHANGNIFAALRDRGLVWNVFVDPPTSLVHFVPPPVCLLQGVHYLNTYSFNDFEKTVKSPTYPEGYTFIEPNYGEVLTQSFKNGSSQHPMDGTHGGEMLIKKTYEAIRNSPHWDDSLLVIVYDEHGGFFDSGKPGVAPAPNDNPGNNPKYDYSLTTKFDFKQYGVRVPAVVVSPRIPKGTVDHTVYDHTSVLATIRHFFNVKSLTDRDKAANSLDKLLTIPPRECPTKLVDPVAPPSSPRSEVTEEIPDDQNTLPDSGNVHGFLATLLKTDLELTSNEQERNQILSSFAQIKTVADASSYAKKVNEKIERYRG